MLGYAPDGDVTSANDSVNGDWTSFQYDGLNRLVASSCTAHCPDGQNTQAFSYVYDRFGNRWQQNVTAGAGPSPQFSFDANNRIAAGVAYDAAGELTSDGTHTYQYDAAGRLTGVDGGATASYVYDAEGRRVERAVGGQKFEDIYDLSGHMVAEMAAANGAWQRGEVFGAGRHIASYADGTTYFPHADWLGTERVRATAGDNPYEACASLWFGDGLSCRFAGSSLDPSPLHFTGKERDSESGNDYFGARYYGSSMGRFLSPDWSAKEEPVPYAKLDDPQTLNLYGYVRNNPLGGVDADGHCPWCLALAGGEVLADESPLALTGPVGWTVIGATAVGVLGVAAYQHFLQSSSDNAPSPEQGRDAQGKFLPKQAGQTQPGADAEKGALEAEGATKTGTALPGTNRRVDGTVTETGQKIEVKSGEYVSNTGQLVATGEAAKKATGQPLLVVTTNPNVKVSVNAEGNQNLQIRPVKQPR